MAPSLALACLFTFYPAVESWRLALLDWSGPGTPEEFVGMDNFTEVVNDPYFWHALGRSAVFAVAAAGVTLVLSLIVAILLNSQALRMRAVYRTFFFLPVVTTAAIVGVVSKLIMNPFDGPLNTALLKLHLIDHPIDFLGDPHLSLWSVGGAWVWKTMGLTMVYWLVALQTVPKDVYEAAAVDGAGFWTTHRRITVPLISPFALVIALITFANALRNFALVQTMTGGGPNFSTELIEVYIYRLAFASTLGSSAPPRYGYASAVAVLFGITVLVVVLAQGWGVRRMRGSMRPLKTDGE